MALPLPNRKRLLHGMAVGLVAALAAVVFWRLGWLESLELRTYDWRARILAEPSPNRDRIQLILVDQNSLDWASNELGLGWPWPREMYAAVAVFCRRAGVRSLAFDVLFTEPSKYGVSDDRRFGRAIETQGSTMLPVFLGRSTGQERVWPPDAPDTDIQIIGMDSWLRGRREQVLTFQRGAFPTPEIRAGARLLANVASQPDPDGVYRRLPLFALFDGHTVPSLALAMRLAGTRDLAVSLERDGLRLDGATTRLDGSGQALINFRQPGGYTVHSAAQIIRSEMLLREGKPPTIDPGSLSGSYVLFGFVAPGLFDLRPSPVSGISSGTEIHAAALDNLLAGDFIAPSPEWLALLLLIILPVAAALAVFLTPAGHALAAVLALFLPPIIATAAYALGWHVPLAGPTLGAAAAVLASLAVLHATEGRQRRFIRSAFGRYLSPAVIDMLIRQPERMRLGGEQRTLSIFFADIENFTAISEGLSPEALTEFLNNYLSAMTDIILDEGGTLDKYEGDAIIAFWNAPLDQPDHAERCIRAALRCQKRLAAMQPEFAKRVGRAVRMRIGLNTGPAVVGNLGSNARFDYSMIGDAVNIASRLEGANKVFGTYTIVSDETLAASGQAFPARALARVVVVGRSAPLLIHEPLTPEDFAARAEALEMFDRGRALYCHGDLDKALRCFEAFAETDPPSAAYAAQCRRLLSGQGVPDGWCGDWRLTRK